MARIHVQAEPFDPGIEIAALLAGRTDVGGVGCFVGTVRGTAAGHPIEAMTLEHYPGMTERAMAAIAAEAERRWPLLGCTVIHRTGRLVPGDPIAFLIDWLKTKAPFWKQEHLASGATSWVAAKDDDTRAATRW